MPFVIAFGAKLTEIERLEAPLMDAQKIYSIDYVALIRQKGYYDINIIISSTVPCFCAVRQSVTVSV